MSENHMVGACGPRARGDEEARRRRGQTRSAFRTKSDPIGAADDRAGHPYPRPPGPHAVRSLPQKLKLELTWKTAETMAKAMNATNEKAATRTEAEIVCETAPSQRSRSAR